MEVPTSQVMMQEKVDGVVRPKLNTRESKMNQAGVVTNQNQLDGAATITTMMIETIVSVKTQTAEEVVVASEVEAEGTLEETSEEEVEAISEVTVEAVAAEEAIEPASNAMKLVILLENALMVMVDSAVAEEMMIETMIEEVTIEETIEETTEEITEEMIEETTEEVIEEMIEEVIKEDLAGELLNKNLNGAMTIKVAHGELAMITKEALGEMTMRKRMRVEIQDGTNHLLLTHLHFL